MNDLLRLSIRENSTFDFDYFSGGLPYQSEYWQNRLGQFYLKYKKYDQAIKFFDKGRKEFEETARIYNGLGQAYLGKENKKLAIEYFKTAVDIAIQNSDDKLESYRTNLHKAEKG